MAYLCTRELSINAILLAIPVSGCMYCWTLLLCLSRLSKNSEYPMLLRVLLNVLTGLHHATFIACLSLVALGWSVQPFRPHDEKLGRIGVWCILIGALYCLRDWLSPFATTYFIVFAHIGVLQFVMQKVSNNIQIFTQIRRILVRC